MSYRGFDIKEMTLDDVRDLIGSADDGVDHQIRVADNGRVFLSETVGAEGLKGIQFRFETFDAGNGYVGHDAAENYQYIYQICNLRSPTATGAVVNGHSAVRQRPA